VIPAAAAILLLPVAAPLAVAAALAVPRLRGGALALAPWAPLPALAAAIGGAGAELDLPWLLLGARLAIDRPGAIFLGLAAALWLAAGAYAREYLREDPAKHRFFVLHLLTATGNLGVAIAHDMPTFALFFALMGFAAFGLVAHAGTPAAREAAKIYVALVVVGEMLVFAAMVVGARSAGSVLFADVRAAIAHAPAGVRGAFLFLALAGFAVKVGGLPLHVWLPLAHPAAPTPASAVLSGAMVKAGLLGWMRLLPLGEVTLPGPAAAVIGAGLAAAFFGVAAGVTQRDPKTALAYSTVSQMGLATVGVGVGLAAPEEWLVVREAILMFALHHGVSKGALFLGVGIAPGLTSPAGAGGAARLGARLRAAAILLPAIALAGAPFTTGALAKAGIEDLSPLAPGGWPRLLPPLLALSAFGTSLLMARFLWIVWPRQPPRRPTPRGMVAPFAVLAAGTVAVPLVWAGPGALPDLPKVIAAIAPIAAAAAIAATLVRAAQEGLRSPVLPAGDLLWPVLAAVRPFARWARRAGPRVARLRARAGTRGGALARGAEALDARLAVEAKLARGGASGTLFLVLAALAWAAFAASR
jgi:formate hydrogenlyase subunit 3/multisubunit Na+/H+ antiporter MnhD subunit